jgi:peptidyl-prolyl cis-trans isomerase C
MQTRWQIPVHRAGRGLALIGALLVSIGTLAGCKSESQSPTATSEHPAAQKAASGEVVATYNGEKLTSDEVTKELERLPPPSRTYLASPERKRQFVDNLIMNDLLFDEGKKSGIDRDPEIDRQVTDLRKRLVVQRVMRQYQTPPTISDEQAKAYYDANPDLYSTTQIHASHILVKDENTAKEIREELKAHPDKFADLAREKSTDTTTAPKGGDLGMFGQGRMVPDFERAAFALKPSEISDVVKTQYGYHIITVTERKEGERKPFEQVKEQIRATLRNKTLQDQTQNHFEELRKAANVKIDEEALARVTPPPATAGAAPGANPLGIPSGH